MVPGELRLSDMADNDMLDSASPRGRKLRVNVYQHGAENQVRFFFPSCNCLLLDLRPHAFHRDTRKNTKLRFLMFQVVTINGARVKRHDMIATNGVIHVTDKVLYPMADLSILDHLTNCDTFTGKSPLHTTTTAAILSAFISFST